MQVPVVMAVCSKTLLAGWKAIKWLFCLRRCSPHRFVVSWFIVFIQVRPFRTPRIGGPLNTGIMVDQTRLGQQIGDTEVRNDRLETITAGHFTRFCCQWARRCGVVTVPWNCSAQSVRQPDWLADPVSLCSAGFVPLYQCIQDTIPYHCADYTNAVWDCGILFFPITLLV